MALKTLTALMSIFCFLAPSAQAENWVLLGEGETGSVYYVDIDSILFDDTETEFWIKTDASSDVTVAYKEAKNFMRMNCAKRQFTIKYTIEYFRSGKLENYGPFADPMTPIPPGSIADAWRAYICD